MLENLYSKTPAIALFPGIERCDLPPSFILASVCSSRKCYERLDHGLDSFPFSHVRSRFFPGMPYEYNAGPKGTIAKDW